jgi:hypothetical protein
LWIILFGIRTANSDEITTRGYRVLTFGKWSTTPLPTLEQVLAMQEQMLQTM